MNNRVTEEIIKITFGDNWLIAAFVFVVAVVDLYLKLTQF